MIKFFCFICCFVFSFAFAQETYNNCNQALELCPQKLFSVNNLDATKTLCPDCEDDFTFCFSSKNSIWFTFETNDTGGDVNVDFSNLVFETGTGQGTELQASILQATIPCNASTYTSIGNCVNNASTNFSLIATGLPANTTYYVVVSGNNGLSSPAEANFDIQISGTGVNRPTPNIFINAVSDNICEDEVYQANVSISNCPDSSDYFWYVNDVLKAVTSDPFFTSSELVSGDVVSVKCTCFADCKDTISATETAVTVTSISINAGIDQIIDYGDTTQLHALSSASTYYWTPGFLVSDSSSLNPYAWPTSSTVFTLTVTENGCTVSDEVLIEIKFDLNIPNTFSPNDDGLNDTWEIGGIENYPDCSVRIHNRWGQQVFLSSGYHSSKAFNGASISGTKLNEGVYFYIIDLNDADNKQFKGSITLIR